MLEAGAYKDHSVNFSLIAHPGITADAALVRTAAYATFKVEYFGKEAHSAARPWDGVGLAAYRFDARTLTQPGQCFGCPGHCLQRRLGA